MREASEAPQDRLRDPRPEKARIWAVSLRRLDGVDVDGRATAADKSFDVELKPKARATTTLGKPGTIAFTCRNHPGMKGVLSVAR